MSLFSSQFSSLQIVCRATRAEVSTLRVPVVCWRSQRLRRENECVTGIQHHRSAAGLRYLVVKKTSLLQELPYAVGRALNPNFYNLVAAYSMHGQSSTGSSALTFLVSMKQDSCVPDHHFLPYKSLSNLSQNLGRRDLGKAFLAFQLFSRSLRRNLCPLAPQGKRVKNFLRRKTPRNTRLRQRFC